MVVLGVDPGIATVGFGVIDAAGGSQRLLRCGVITTSPDMRLARRLKQIYSDIQEIIGAFNPDCMVIEELFFNTNLKTAVSVAHGRGVVILAGETRGVPMYEYTPLQVKQAVTGYGRAEKKQVMDMVRRLLSMDATPKPDDAADALAVAICHARFAGSLINIVEDSGCSTI
ncbi:MAG: crossover junction endodeoxyribonuclease RuvC [Oscillospiraceae bacterium]|jgi:crossover junction endodeoxyribonuclease RuvC|nr:crossover junction endodeoxyribonuclease RuvC [Oscillospiraceae bacterium]